MAGPTWASAGPAWASDAAARVWAAATTGPSQLRSGTRTTTGALVRAVCAGRTPTDPAERARTRYRTEDMVTLLTSEWPSPPELRSGDGFGDDSAPDHRRAYRSPGVAGAD